MSLRQVLSLALLLGLGFLFALRSGWLGPETLPQDSATTPEAANRSALPEVAPQAQEELDAFARAPVGAALNVRVIEAKMGELSATRVTQAVIAPARESTVAAPSEGRVLAVLKREDMPVEAGEAVIRLDTDALELRRENARLAVNRADVSLQEARQANQEEQAQASRRVTTTETNLRLAEQRFREGQELFDIGAISSAELTRLEAELAQAQSDIEQAQAELARSGRANEERLEILRLQRSQAANDVAQLDRQIAEAVITAPYAGEITTLLVDEGEFVRNGTAVFELASLDEQIVTFNVPPDIGAGMREDGIIYIKYSGNDFAARVLSQSRVDVETQLVEVTAELYGSEERIPNGVVTQLPYIDEAAEGILLPSAALQREGAETFVYLAQADRAVRQAISVIAEIDDQVAVEGLSQGDQVIYPIPRSLREGSQLNIDLGVAPVPLSDDATGLEQSAEEQ